ncbi:YxeA family protein [Levilactobacillus tangyuanensis]|uniref:YxeA family protein n=1 Tax=Levilactobacillus tangyuanensis TaxID=2486021 RepID=A0ABW1TPJ5_9LACO|nr:YxeA family protein [Levilactobacillus tangyuanensis]
MKIIKRLLGLAALLIGILGLTAALVPQMTRNQHSEWAMALDNVNPLVKSETVYASTSAKPVREYIGGGGEKEYTYQLLTYNQSGTSRTLTFDSQWRLKPNKFLQIETKGQNVESWSAVVSDRIPGGVKKNLATV